MSKIVFIATGAHSIANASDALARERYIEYMIALHKIFTYNKPVYSVLSEYNSEISHCPPFDLFSMTILLKLPISFLDDAKTKSQREFLSIKELVRNMNLEDDTFVIKISREIMNRIIQNRPEIANAMSEVLAKRQMANQKISEATLPEERYEQEQKTLTERIYAQICHCFFGTV